MTTALCLRLGCERVGWKQRAGAVEGAGGSCVAFPVTLELDALLCGDATYRTIYIEYNTFQKYDLFVLSLLSGDFKGPLPTPPTPHTPIPLSWLCWMLGAVGAGGRGRGRFCWNKILGLHLEIYGRGRAMQSEARPLQL